MRPIVLAAVLAASLAPAAVAQARPQTREGFWASFGFGYGSLGCEDCVDRISGSAAYVRLGGTLSRRVLLGGEITGWAKSERGATLAFTTFGPVVVFYPSARGGFYLKGGTGVASLDLDAGRFSGDATGGALVLGLGYDGRVGRSFSLTPFLDIVSAAFDDGTVNSLHFGLGFTFH